MAEPLVEHGSPHHSDEELAAFDIDEIVGLPVPADGPHVLGPAVPLALPEPLLMMEPLYDIGVQTADIAPTGKANCLFCKSKIGRGDVRLSYHPAKSVFKFVHPKCFDQIPPSHVSKIQKGRLDKTI